MKSYHRITKEERYQIYALNKAGWSIKAIALDLKRSPSSISRELKRNRGQRGYRAAQAHTLAAQRQAISASNARRICPTHWPLIEAALKKDWSPEQIAGRTGLASMESIYAYVYRDKARGGMLWKHLRCQKEKRKRYGSGRDRRGQIPDRIPIAQRLPEVDAKQRLGDWEGDTIIGTRNRGAVLVTLTERRSQLVKIRKAACRRADQINQAIIDALRPLAICSHTLTVDNGKEFSGHRDIRNETGIDVYFADPYASWQRGLNEQINGLIRQYCPKGASLEHLTDEEVAMIEDKLNNRPRKTLGYRTPIEVFCELAIEKGVALRT